MANNRIIKVLAIFLFSFLFFTLSAQTLIVPPASELNMPFSVKDIKNFRTPPKVYFPETWFHFIGGNVSLSGITADLKAIKAAGISGVQLFHGQFGGAWPGVKPQITCLSPLWDNAVKYTAQECKRLGLRFTMQNCPGWAMAGGPWIKPSNAMRTLVWSRTDVDTSQIVHVVLPKPLTSSESWRDYKDIAVIAFPTPLGDTGKLLLPSSVISGQNLDWKDCLYGMLRSPLELPPVSSTDPYNIEISFPKETIIRTVELPSIKSLNSAWCYEPGIIFKIEAISDSGKTQTVAQLNLPQSNWQDNSTFSIACSEVRGTRKYQISFYNKHKMTLSSIRLFTAARKNSWESEAGWTLRSYERSAEHPEQSSKAYLKQEQIYDLSDAIDSVGNLKWIAPCAGKWTILRIGNVNAGRKNGPAPAEGTGWECNKLSESGANAQFAGYIGRLINGPLKDGLLDGMLMDSWECGVQTWTSSMEDIFLHKAGYPLRKWLPAIFGYVIKNQETTARFLLDWRSTLGDLYTDQFFGRMAKLAKSKGLSIQFETAMGDVVPGDILEYYKYADVPMCEFWQPMTDGYVGSLNFKPIKMTASAAHVYGKPRVAAESFTSFDLTWDEHWEMLKEVANVNYVEGVTHSVFHTYTHNPKNLLPPGTSFGASIGTPFLRGETWWKYMPEFTTYLARCSYLLERGKPVSDVLWYLGDEINHKPNQNITFPKGFKYDYCNPDVLLNRLSVKNGRLVTPEGISYKVLWIPDNERMLPQTLERLYMLICNGATVIGNAPKGLATLQGGVNAQRRFDVAVKNIWGNTALKGIYKIGKGTIVSGLNLNEALQKLQLLADVKGGNVMWLHRKINETNWYYVCSPKGGNFKGILDFHCSGKVECWDPLTGNIFPLAAEHKGDYTSVQLNLPHAGCCFVVFSPTKNVHLRSVKVPLFVKTLPLNLPWTLSFPSGWGTPSSLQLTKLKAWKNLNMSKEAKAFSGTVTYKTSFSIDKIKHKMCYILDLGKVEMIATVFLNGKKLRTLWTTPYRLDISNALRMGNNLLDIKVTSSWFNRLVYDGNLSEDQRKTWTIAAPDKKLPLRESGLLGPVVISCYKM